MDVAHHAAIGTAGMLTFQAAGEDAAGVAFVAASVIPDLDVAFMVLGKRFRSWCAWRWDFSFPADYGGSFCACASPFAWL